MLAVSLVGNCVTHNVPNWDASRVSDTIRATLLLHVGAPAGSVSMNY